MRLELFWRQMVGTGTEHMILSLDGAVHADGLAVGEVNDAAYRIHYELDCDFAWNVQRVLIEDLLCRKILTLVRTDRNRWSDAAGQPLETLDGSTDVDIMITPFTNTLPIRRLNLKPGQSSEIAVVYVSVPDLAATRAEQRYTCLELDGDGGIYRYVNLRSNFTTDLNVDPDGLVVTYPNSFVMDVKRKLAWA
jgi:uncharacterized protein